MLAACLSPSTLMWLMFVFCCLTSVVAVCWGSATVALYLCVGCMVQWWEQLLYAYENHVRCEWAQGTGRAVQCTVATMLPAGMDGANLHTTGHPHTPCFICVSMLGPGMRMIWPGHPLPFLGGCPLSS
jgi:hypothetical protein